MRALAAHLGRSTMAAYRHVENRENLIRLAAESVRPKCRMGPLPWYERLEAIARHGWTTCWRPHPWVVDFIGSGAITPKAIRRLAVMEEVFSDAGFDGTQTDKALTAHWSFVIGTLRMIMSIRATTGNRGTHHEDAIFDFNLNTWVLGLSAMAQGIDPGSAQPGAEELARGGGPGLVGVFAEQAEERVDGRGGRRPSDGRQVVARVQPGKHPYDDTPRPDVLGPRPGHEGGTSKPARTSSTTPSSFEHSAPIGGLVGLLRQKSSNSCRAAVPGNGATCGIAPSSSRRRIFWHGAVASEKITTNWREPAGTVGRSPSTSWVRTIPTSQRPTRTASITSASLVGSARRMATPGCRWWKRARSRAVSTMACRIPMARSCPVSTPVTASTATRAFSASRSDRRAGSTNAFPASVSHADDVRSKSLGGQLAFRAAPWRRTVSAGSDAVRPPQR